MAAVFPKFNMLRHTAAGIRGGQIGSGPMPPGESFTAEILMDTTLWPTMPDGNIIMIMASGDGHVNHQNYHYCRLDVDLANRYLQFTLGNAQIGGANCKSPNDSFKPGVNMLGWAFNAADYSMTFYVNGAPVGTGTNTYSGGSGFRTWACGGAVVRASGGLTCDFQNTEIRFGEVRLWSTYRTSDQINGFWNRPLNGNEDGLVAYYRGVQNNGVLYNASKGGGSNITLTTPAASVPLGRNFVQSQHGIYLPVGTRTGGFGR